MSVILGLSLYFLKKKKNEDFGRITFQSNHLSRIPYQTDTSFVPITQFFNLKFYIHWMSVKNKKKYIV